LKTTTPAPPTQQAFSPIFQHYGESLAGLTTIRAFGRQDLFADVNRVGAAGFLGFFSGFLPQVCNGGNFKVSDRACFASRTRGLAVATFKGVASFGRACRLSLPMRGQRLLVRSPSFLNLETPNFALQVHIEQSNRAWWPIQLLNR
jgi:hypothetical protein